MMQNTCLFNRFFKCVCEGTATDCTASLAMENSIFVVQTLNQSGNFNGNQGVPRYYQCELVTYENRFTCTQISKTDSVCSTSPYFQSARFNITASCDKSCFTLFWTYGRRDLPGGWFNECEVGKGCQAVTTSTITTTAKTTQKPTTASVSPPASTPSLPSPASPPSLSPLASTTSKSNSSSSSLSYSSPLSSSHVSPNSNSSTPPLPRETTTSAGTTPTSRFVIVYIIMIIIAVRASLPNRL